MSVALRLSQPKLAFAAVLFGCSLFGPALAQDKPAIFGGGFVADDHFGYFGALVPLPGARPDQGWAVRPIASAGAYDYRRGAAEFDADYVNLELSLVHRRSGEWGYLNLGAGVRYSNTDLSLDDPLNPREGEQWDGLVSIDGARHLGDWRAGGYASYAFDIQDYYIRGEVTRALRPGGLRLGVETIIEGDPTYDRQSLGAMVAFEPMTGTEVRLSVGGRMGDRDTEPYVAIGASRSF
ncbi:cellulose biosynthesis protein BcsS [Brevundimonas sp.]|uniref:cellulose biosynthesis protein BcsS n=1 Tax=Brevundimonas sp. TaxID=1871086 RepID=UPI003D6C731A